MAELGSGGSLGSSLSSGFALIWFPLLRFFSVSPILRLVVLGCLRIQLGSMKNSERLGFPTFVVLDKGRPALRNSIVRLRVGSPRLPDIHLATVDWSDAC